MIWSVKKNQTLVNRFSSLKVLVFFTAFIIVIIEACFPVNCQSIPVIVNPPGNNVPGQTYGPPPGYRPPNGLPSPHQGMNPIVSGFQFLGNLLGGLTGALPVTPPQMPPPGGNYGRELPPRLIECRAVFHPPGDHHHGHHHGSNNEPTDPSMSNSNRTGFCVSSPNECRGRGGQLLGPCFRRQGGPHGLPIGPPFGACCFFEATCGGQVHVNGSHFRSPDFPNPYPGPGSCSVSIKNTYRNTCQIRLDFYFFNLKQPMAGNCNQDRLVVSGQASNDIIPSICGFNPGQHCEL